MRVEKLYTSKASLANDVLVSHSGAKAERRGFVALIIIAIIGSAVLSMAIGASLLGIGVLDVVYTAERGQEAFYATDGCVEEALRRLRLNGNYTGAGETITFPSLGASCTASVTTFGVNGRRIIATGLGANGMYRRSIQMEITLSAENIITVSSWREIAL